MIGGMEASLLYSSRAVRTLADEDLRRLLVRSRVHNWSRGVTGLLISGNGRFLHHLEGPRASVADRMSRIRDDPRHDDVVTLASYTSSIRLFPRWTMAFADAASAPDIANILEPGTELARVMRTLHDLAASLEKTREAPGDHP